MVGTPSEDFYQRMGAERVKTYISKLPNKQAVELDTIYEKANPVGLKLLSQMLKLDPLERITATQALEHEYLEKYHDIDDEPDCFSPFDFSFDQQSISKESLKKSIIEEIECYTKEPDAVQAFETERNACGLNEKQDFGKFRSYIDITRSKSVFADAVQPGAKCRLI